MKPICLLSVLLLFAHVLGAQTHTIDSLRKKVYQAKNSTERKQRIIDLLDQQRSLNPDSMISYAQQLRSLSPASDSAGQINADAYVIFYLSRNGLLDSANKLLNADLLRLESTVPDKSLRLKFYFLKSGIQLKNNDHKEALDACFKTLRLAEQLKDTSYEIRALNGIGWVYMEMEQTREALNWFFKALHTSKNTRYASAYCVVYANIASCYGMLDKLDSVDYYATLALSSAERYDDLLTRANATVLKANLLIIHSRYDEAIAVLKKAIDIRKVLNDPFYIISDMSSLSYLYGNTNRPKEGIATANEAIAIARQHNLQSKLPLVYYALAYNLETAKDYKSMSTVLSSLLSLKDSIYQKAKAEDLAEMQAKYETEKKIAEIRILQKENELKDAKNKNLFYISGSIILLLIGGGAFTYTFLSARQKKKLAEEKVNMERLKLQAVIQTQEDERKRISAELHDGIGPVLSAVKLNLSMLEPLTQDDKRYATAIQLIDRSYNELRSVSHAMMPSTLLKLGLVEAVEQLATGLNISGALQVLVLSEDRRKRYGETIEIHLYRIIQEVLNNILKHAHATAVQIQLSEEDNELVLMIEDNGNGFDPAALYQSKGNGWSNIISRLRIINGTIELDTQKGKKGSVVYIVVPLVAMNA